MLHNPHTHVFIIVDKSLFVTLKIWISTIIIMAKQLEGGLNVFCLCADWLIINFIQCQSNFSDSLVQKYFVHLIVTFASTLR